MPCFGNGGIISPPSGLEHYHFTDVADAAAAETISISEVLPKHCVLEQFSVHWSAVPTTVEYVVLTKVSAIDPAISVVLRRVEPSTSGENLTDLVCVIPYYFEAGDTVTLTYANTDDETVGAEIMLVEVP